MEEQADYVAAAISTVRYTCHQAFFHSCYVQIRLISEEREKLSFCALAASGNLTVMNRNTDCVFRPMCASTYRKHGAFLTNHARSPCLELLSHTHSNMWPIGTWHPWPMVPVTMPTTNGRLPSPRPGKHTKYWC
jgi:hypothetical protein